MNDTTVNNVVEAARDLIVANDGSPVRGMRALHDALTNFDAERKHERAHLHPIASEQTDDLQEVAK